MLLPRFLWNFYYSPVFLDWVVNISAPALLQVCLRGRTVKSKKRNTFYRGKVWKKKGYFVWAYKYTIPFVVQCRLWATNGAPPYQQDESSSTIFQQSFYILLWKVIWRVTGETTAPRMLYYSSLSVQLANRIQRTDRQPALDSREADTSLCWSNAWELLKKVALIKLIMLSTDEY